jgi:hypothetical protein
MSNPLVWEALQIMDDLQAGETIGARDSFVRVDDYDQAI